MGMTALYLAATDEPALAARQVTAPSKEANADLFGRID